MNFSEALHMALDSLRANRLRSALTLLGIVIGVMTVITVVSFISGLNNFVAQEIVGLGIDVFTISRAPGIIVDPDEFREIQARPNLLLDDAEAVREACTRCRLVGAQRFASARIQFGAEFIEAAQVRGLTPETPEILAQELAEGRFIAEYDVRHGRRVAVVGADVAETLFGFLDPMGKRFYVNEHEFQVVGVGEAEGTILGQSRDNWVAIPIRSFERIWGSARIGHHLRQGGHGEANLQLAQDQARTVLRTRRHVPYSEEDNFSIATNDTFLEIWASISRVFFAVTVAIASISLVVGGIVVMNIMLVSVTERTREIGIRKAIGARSVDVRRQFLVESAILALLGGVVGVLLAIVLTMGVSSLTGLPAVIRWWSVLIGLMVSTSVGLFFGIWPAQKAARLDPIAALRYE